MKSNNERVQTSLLLVFFISGFAALMYQVIWQRWLVFFTGIGSVSISLIVSAFMTGLGVGYWAGGTLSDKIGQKKQILLFVFAELGIGTFACISKPLLYDFLYGGNVIQSGNPLENYAVLFLFLLVPTFLMGVSLPLLSKAIALKNTEKQASFVGKLYFVNTLGAAFGAIITSVVFIRWMGFHDAVLVGASLNFLCAAIALVIYFREKKSVASTVVTSSAPLRWSKDFVFWLTQYAITGFMAISFEIIWFRMIDVMIKSISFSFSIILFIYLASMAMGSRFGVYYQNRTRRNLRSVYFNVQYFLYVYSIGGILLLLLGLEHLENLAFIKAYFFSYDPTFEGLVLLFTYLLIPLFLMAIPTFIMGFSFSISQRIVQNDYSEFGRKLGWLQFTNIAGSSVGAWLVTLIGFNIIGTALTIKIIGLIGLFYIWLSFKNKFLSLSKSIVAGIFLLMIAFLIPVQNGFWRIFLGVEKESEVVFNEDDTALSSIKMQEAGVGVVFMNGLGQSSLPFKQDLGHVALGSIPALVHPNPQDIAIIGLGSGGTLYSVAARSETRKIDCFEVIVNQPDVLTKFAEKISDTPINAILNDKRVNMILYDGRFEIQNNAKRYDIIEADALRPISSYSGNIYSKEYFEILKSKLKPNGIVASWSPTGRVDRTFLTVFPHVYKVGDFILVGSNEPLQITKASVLKNTEAAFTQRHFNAADMNIQEVLGSYMDKIEVLQNGSLTSQVDINTDMFPKDEYDKMADLYHKILWVFGQD